MGSQSRHWKQWEHIHNNKDNAKHFNKQPSQGKLSQLKFSPLLKWKANQNHQPFSTLKFSSGLSEQKL